MSLFIRSDNERTDLQQRIAAELRAKAAETSKQEAARPHGIEDSAYLEGTKSTSSLAWVWLLFAAVGIAVLIWLVLATR
ncbi:hypothetical protein KBD87_02715 [Candidatus Saccharibacteria bacterium]|jgi:hypothetical protein|nr:hypothetical protein [Candidatus Saccharibacteria bacterium]